MVEANALELVDVAVARGGRMLLSGVSFTAPPGAFIALRGPNGSGKTSLIRAIAGLARLAEGDARFGETSRREDAEAYREAVLYGGHLDAVKPNLTLGENLVFWSRFYRVAEADSRADAALKRFGLEHMADAPAGQCSAGQKRRLGLARLAASNRPVWLLDEPTVSLDAASVTQLSGLIEEHCRAGGIVIAATHQDFSTTESISIDVGKFAGRPAPDAASAPAEEDPFLQGFDKPVGGR